MKIPSLTITEPENLATSRDIAKLFLENFQGDIALIKKIRLAMDEGDFWQKGEGWNGPHPMCSDQSTERKTMALFERAFVAQDKLSEITERHIGGVIGTPPHWAVTTQRQLEPGEELTADESKRIQRIESLLTRFWDDRKVLLLLHDALFYRVREGRAITRIFVPSGLLQSNDDNEDEDESNDATAPVPQGTMEQQLNRLFVEMLHPDNALTATDTETMAEVGVVRIYESKPIGQAKSITVRKYEVCYVKNPADEKEDQATILRVIENQKRGQSVISEIEVNIGGRLLIGSMVGRPLITRTLYQQQMLLNKALTGISLNLDHGADLREVWLNADMPVEEYEDALTGETKTRPALIERGIGTFTNLVGVSTISDSGGQSIAQPSVVWHNPTEPTVFTRSREEAANAMYEETHQLHALLSGDAAVSGESRIQALADFALSLLNTSQEVVSFTTWLLETVMHLCADFANEQDVVKDLKITVEPRLNLGRLTPDERRIIIEEVSAKLRDRQSAMSLLGVNDTDEAEQRIAADVQDSQDRQLQVIQAQAEAVAARAATNPNTPPAA